jgi:hypothetical protein
MVYDIGQYYAVKRLINQEFLLFIISSHNKGAIIISKFVHPLLLFCCPTEQPPPFPLAGVEVGVVVPEFMLGMTGAVLPRANGEPAPFRESMVIME